MVAQELTTRGHGSIIKQPEQAEGHAILRISKIDREGDHRLKSNQIPHAYIINNDNVPGRVSTPSLHINCMKAFIYHDY